MSSALSFSASSSAAWAALCELSDPSRATRIFLNKGVDTGEDGSVIRLTVFDSIRLTHIQKRAGRKAFAPTKYEAFPRSLVMDFPVIPPEHSPEMSRMARRRGSR